MSKPVDKLSFFMGGSDTGSEVSGPSLDSGYGSVSSMLLSYSAEKCGKFVLDPVPKPGPVLGAISNTFDTCEDNTPLDSNAIKIPEVGVAPSTTHISTTRTQARNQRLRAYSCTYTQCNERFQRKEDLDWHYRSVHKIVHSPSPKYFGLDY